MQTLLAAQQALRPDVGQLKGRAAAAETLVQRALWRLISVDGDGGTERGASHHTKLHRSGCGWTRVLGPDAAASRADPAQPNGDARKPSVSDARRRRAQAVSDDRDKAPLMMFFRAESVMSWGEFIKVNRATDDDPDENASNVANDMDVLAIAPDGESAASRVKFDLDLPSAAADDRPLGPGQRFPEWDYRRNALVPDHCALQTFVAQTRRVLCCRLRP